MYKNYLHKRVLLPVSSLLQGQSIYSKLRFLEKSQWWSREQIDEFQNVRLRLLINHSVRTVPYYQELFSYHSLKIDDIQTKKDLYKIPLLRKSDIKKHGQEMFLSKEYLNEKLINASSSGSTGEPLFYKCTKDSYSMNIAANLRGWQWMGFHLGDKYIKLSQNKRSSLIKRAQDWISNNYYLSTSPLIDSNFKHILEEIEKYKPKIIRCYPDPLLFLARYKKNHLEFTYRPLAINCTGNTLYPETRIEIEEAFGCKVFDSYSCEGNSNVFECETHSGYHSSEEYGISEILDLNGNSVQEGVGRLISTDLWNFAHPFIRYETQDSVEVHSEKCKCGRNLLGYKRILGRDSDIVTSKIGEKFIVHNFTIFFSLQNTPLNKSVDNFQLVKIEEVVIFNLVVNNNFNENVRDYIRTYWEEKFGYPVQINIVDEIKITKFGKRRFIINE